jgi:hypothetical protein
MSELRQISARLRRFSRVRRGLLGAALVYRLGTYALTAGTVGLLLLNGWIANAWVNLGVLAVLVCFWCGLVVAAVVRRPRFRGLLDEALRMESLIGGLNSRLISAWDFLQREMDSPLCRAVIGRAQDDLRLDFEARLDRRDRNRRRKHLAATLLVFAVVGLTPWFGFAAAWGNLSRSWLAASDYLFPVAYRLEPQPGTHVYRLGQQIALAIQFPQAKYDTVTLVRRLGEETQRIDLAVDATGRAARTITSDVEAEWTAHFEFGRRSSDEVTLVFATPPTLVNMQTELVYPAYTRMLPRSLEGVQQRLAGLPRTRMTLGFTFSKEIEEAALSWVGEDAPPLRLDTSGRFATVELLHQRQRQASLQVRDRYGFSLDSPLLIDFELQEDEKPQLFLPRHLKEDMPMVEKAAALFGFGVQAQDDYGVTRVVLKWQKATVDSPATIENHGEIERLISPVQRKVTVNFEKVFAGLALKPGDKISFQIEAYDNLSPGPAQMTASRRCSLFIFQDALGGLTIRELGFGGDAGMLVERIPKSQRATAVKAPEGLRSKENVRNEFEASVVTGVQAPAVHGEFGSATRDYFRLLSTVKYPDANPPPPAK